MLWVILWSFCGLFVLSQLFTEAPGKEKLSYIIFLAFWLYFEYMTVYAALWRAYGKEVIRIDNRGSTYKQVIGSSIKKNEHVPASDMEEIHLVERDERSFSEHFESSYYVVGRMKVEIKSGEKILRMGEKLSEADARNLAKRIRRAISVFE